MKLKKKSMYTYLHLYMCILTKVNVCVCLMFYFKTILSSWIYIINVQFFRKLKYVVVHSSSSRGELDSQTVVFGGWIFFSEKNYVFVFKPIFPHLLYRRHQKALCPAQSPPVQPHRHTDPCSSLRTSKNKTYFTQLQVWVLWYIVSFWACLILR